MLSNSWEERPLTAKASMIDARKLLKCFSRLFFDAVMPLEAIEHILDWDINSFPWEYV